MIRIPDLVRLYLSAPPVPVPPAVPLIGALETRWRQDFASIPPGVSRQTSRPHRTTPGDGRAAANKRK